MFWPMGCLVFKALVIELSVHLLLHSMVAAVSTKANGSETGSNMESSDEFISMSTFTCTLIKQSLSDSGVTGLFKCTCKQHISICIVR